MSKIIMALSVLNDIVPEGITFSITGYETVTGMWSMEFHAMDELCFMPCTDQWTYTVKAESFLKDVENNVEKFIKTYNEFKPI
jgi:hypothetical protein